MNKQIELAKSILEAKGYKVSNNSIRESSIPISSDCIGLSYFSEENGFSQEEIDDCRETYEDCAEALGCNVNDVLVCSEDEGLETYEYINDRADSAELVKKLLYAPGVVRNLYKLEDGSLVVMHAEFGYVTYYFSK